MLVTSSQALDMLSAHAPRAWAKRLLCWQISVDELALYFSSGTYIKRRYWLTVLGEAQRNPFDLDPILKIPVNLKSAEAIANVRLDHGDDVAAQVEKAVGPDLITLRKEHWENEPRQFPVEVILKAHNLDWESGTLEVELDHDLEPKVGWDFESDHEDDYVSLELSGMCFRLKDIELLAPNGEIPRDGLILEFPSENARPTSRKGGPGRRREYDWDAALFFLVGHAEKNGIAPDPEAHGAQADIKNLLADWFMKNSGKVPADSQLQTMAKRALEAIRSTKA